MNIPIKTILTALGIIVIAWLWLRNGTGSDQKPEKISLDGDQDEKSVSSLPSHVRENRTDPMSAFVDAFKTPIELYGRVEDQHGDPVAGATVTLTPVDSAFADESQSRTTLTSDARGSFSVKGLHGSSMGVSAKHDGYLYLSPLGGPASSVMVDYSSEAEPGKRYSHSETPLVLRLHKIGPMEPMAYVASKRWKLPVNGTARRIALDTDEGTGPHQIEFRFNTDVVNLPPRASNSTHFDWDLEASIPGGGFVWSDNDYNFEAPATGYKEAIRLEYKTDMPSERWQRMVHGSFFVKFADGCHGRIRLSIDGSSDRSPLTLNSWLNLNSGSRNLSTDQKDGTSFNKEKSKKEWGW